MEGGSAHDQKIVVCRLCAVGFARHVGRSRMGSKWRFRLSFEHAHRPTWQHLGIQYQRKNGRLDCCSWIARASSIHPSPPTGGGPSGRFLCAPEFISGTGYVIAGYSINASTGMLAPVSGLYVPVDTRAASLTF